jgi:hypothetical protein
MKKIIYSACMFLLCCTSAFSQLSIHDTTGATLTNGDTVTVSGIFGYQLSDHFFIFNSNGSPINTRIFCIPTKKVTKMNTYSICVGPNCYAPYQDTVTFLSPSFSAPVGKDTNALFTDYNASTAGITVIMFAAFDKSNPADSAWIYVKFDATPTGIAVLSANPLYISAPYPNPAVNVASFSYHTTANAQLTMFNSLGQMVKQESLVPNKDKFTLNVEGITSGIYICRLSSIGAEPVFQKLIISH